MNEIKLVGSNEKRLTVSEQKRLDIALAKNGYRPIKVTNQKSHAEAVVNGLSGDAIEALSSLLDNEPG